MHAVDLGLTVTHHDWPDDFVAAWLPLMRYGVSARLPDGAVMPDRASLDGHDELAWLFGRLRRDDLPELRHWD